MSTTSSPLDAEYLVGDYPLTCGCQLSLRNVLLRLWNVVPAIDSRNSRYLIEFTAEAVAGDEACTQETFTILRSTRAVSFLLLQNDCNLLSSESIKFAGTHIYLSWSVDLLEGYVSTFPEVGRLVTIFCHSVL